MDVITEILKKRNITLQKGDLIKVFLSLYDGLIEEIDALDNGVPMFPEGKPQYTISTHLGSRVHRLNPEWNSKGDVSLDELFLKAVNLVGTEFLDKLMRVRFGGGEFLKGFIGFVSARNGLVACKTDSYGSVGEET